MLVSPSCRPLTPRQLAWAGVLALLLVKKVKGVWMPVHLSTLLLAEYLGWQVSVKASYNCRLAELQTLSVDLHHGGDTLNLQKV